MSISYKKCRIRICTHVALSAFDKTAESAHVALRAILQMDSPEEEVIPPSDSEEELIIESSHTNIENYEPPPFPSDSESEDGSEDSTNITNENAESDGPNEYGLEETPIVNYSGDYQDEDDYFHGWTWNCFPGQVDSGPDSGPFLGKQQLLFDSRDNQPHHFFNEMFSPNTFHEIADSTNLYAARRLDRSEYKIYSSFLPSSFYKKKSQNYIFYIFIFLPISDKYFEHVKYHEYMKNTFK